jgi:tRNA (mo5U34)-methyltransferase
MENETEFLLPKIEKRIILEEFPFIQKNKINNDWREDDLKEKINKLGHWEYYFPFSYGLTTKINSSFDDNTINFHWYRSKLISETIIDLLGEDAKTSNVLDIACHCGVFSMDVAFRGVKCVQGIEFREKNLNQANFLKDYYNINNVSFKQADVYRLISGKDKLNGNFDVVMCLGILYHVIQPIDLIEYCYNLSKKFAVIETICHKNPISAYMVVGDKNPDVAIEGTRSIELHPTYRGVIDSMKQVGFKDIIEIVGYCDKKIDLFSDFSRRCFICAKEPGYFKKK